MLLLIMGALTAARRVKDRPDVKRGTSAARVHPPAETGDKGGERRKKQPLTNRVSNECRLRRTVLLFSTRDLAIRHLLVEEAEIAVRDAAPMMALQGEEQQRINLNTK